MPHMDPSDITFFTAQPYMVDSGLGFPEFGLIHFLYMAYAIAVIVCLTKIYGRLPEGTKWGSPRRNMMIVVAIIPLCLLASQDIIMARAGVFGAQWWPLHSCNLCEYLGLFYALYPNKFSGETLSTLGVVGAACALLFPNWAYCPAWSWPVVCGFSEHSLIIAFITMQIVHGDFTPRMRDVWMPIVLLLAYAPWAYSFNKAHDTNFLFINTPSPGSPMVGLAETFGNPGYIVPIALALFASFFMMHAIWYFACTKKRGNRI